jgi:hypothetical protein
MKFFVLLRWILGCSYEVFVAAVYSGQEMMPDLPRMGDRDLKRLIEEASGMERIERAYAQGQLIAHEAPKKPEQMGVFDA